MCLFYRALAHGLQCDCSQHPRKSCKHVAGERADDESLRGLWPLGGGRVAQLWVASQALNRDDDSHGLGIAAHDGPRNGYALEDPYPGAAPQHSYGLSTWLDAPKQPTD